MKRLLVKMKKVIPMFLILCLLINVPVPLGGGTYVKAAENANLGNIFTKVIMTDESGTELPLNEPLEITSDMVICLLFDWEITNTVSLSAGDYAEIKIPDVFKPISNATDNLLNGDNESVGTFTVSKDTGTLKLVFNDILAEGGEHTEGRNGNVGIVLSFNLSKFEENTNQNVVFDYMENLNFHIMVKPSSDKTSIITKTETHELLNAKEVTWTIDVNTVQNSIEAAGIKDFIPEGLQLIENSVVISPLSVGYNGNLTVGTGAPASYVYNGDTNILTVELGALNHEACRIEYKTKITDYTKAEYKNTAELYDGEDNLGDASKIIDKFTRSALIEKSGSVAGENATKATWTINVNKAEAVISGAAIQDEISDNQTILNNTIKVYRLAKNGANWMQGADVTSFIKELNGLDESGNLQFPISLGNLDGEAYRIVYEADVKYNTDFYDENSSSNIIVSNEAILTEGGIEQGRSEDSKTITRGALIDKSAASSPSYSKKEITWTIVANAGRHPITGAVVYDKLPNGLTLKPGSVTVRNAQGNIVSGVTVSELDENRNFTISLGNISDKYTVTYVTTIEEAFYGNQFNNKAWLTGSGTGIGPGTSEVLAKNFPITPKIENTYEKGTLGVDGTKTYEGISYNGIDYDKKTMSWQITVKPLKRTVTELTITDTFTNNGMVFLPDTLKVFKKQENGNTTSLVQNIDYTIEAAMAGENTGYQYGFVLKLAEGKEWSGADYYIYYKTTFDPNTPDIIKNTGSTYENHARFQGKTSDGNFTENTKASYGLSQQATDNGQKEGIINRNTREITWTINTNYLSVNDGSNIEIQDTFSPGQRLLTDSFIVTKYKLNAAGKVELDGAPLKQGEDYTVDYVSGTDNFTVAITKNTGAPYVIVYKTEMTGLSKNKYTNEAAVTKGGDTKTYRAELPYPYYDKFIEKKATDVDNTTVYPDDEINWKVELNTSLSEIENAVFTDIISAGHIYVLDSLKVYKITNITTGARDEVLPGEGIYTLKEEKDTSAGVWKLRVSFLNTITSAYEIEYKTVVTATNGTITNNAKLTGEGVNSTSNANNGSGFTVRQLVFGTGGGTTNKGSISIQKRDKDTNALITVSPAEFELYYYLNGDKITVSGSTQSTQNGTLKYTGLSYRTYYLKEITAPDGYYLKDDVYTIEVNSGTKDVTIEIDNERKKSIKVIKTDSYNNSKTLSGAEFLLVKTEANGAELVIATESTNINGEILFTNLEYGNYKLIEKKASDSYQLPENPEIIISEINTDTANPLVINVTNESVKKLKVIKTDKKDSNKKLEGAEFKLFNSSGVQVGDIYRSDSDGVIEVSNLDNGSYKLVEITPPGGYQLPEDPETNIIINSLADESSDGNKDNIITKVIENAQLKTIKIIKVDKEDVNKRLKDAVFKFYDEKGTLLGTYSTDENGEFEITDLKVGRYKLVETNAPAGYKLPDNPVTPIEITYDMEYDTILPSIGNEVYRSIRIVKVDREENGTVLKDAEFELWKDGVKVADNIKTDNYGAAIIPNLILGSYRLIEIKAPEGYITPGGQEAETDINIEVGYPLEIPVTIENDLKRQLIIRKIDSNNKTKLLEGAEFTVKTPEGTILILKTGADGTAALSDLNFGTYVVTETKAPQGYQISSLPKTIVIDNTSKVFTLEIGNTVYIPVPYPSPEPSVTPTPTPIIEPTPAPTAEPTLTPGNKPTPVPTKTPEPTKKPKPTPTPALITEITKENTPKGGIVPVPKDGKINIGKKPKNGKATVDDKGKWTYTPDKDYTGKDKFTIVITHSDGKKEEIMVDIDVDKMPLGTVKPNTGGTGNEVKIPKTGETLPIGTLPIAIGGVIGGVIALLGRKRKDTKK